MAETVTNYRRIDRLKALAIEQGFTNEDAKQFGKLSKTATWEALLETYGIPLQVVDTVDSTVDSKAQSLDTSDWTNDGFLPGVQFYSPELNQFFRLG
jgi:crotonobetainyl-CoA:carnitine CoA-transferase CaiB-like acyl-CoA transferase